MRDLLVASRCAAFRAAFAGATQHFAMRHLGEAGTLNERLGIDRDHAEARSLHLMDRQFDLARTPHFYVALRGLQCGGSRNVLLLEGETDPRTGAVQIGRRDVLARCVVSSPFIFDRGQPNSVELQRPTTLKGVHVELLRVDGRTPLQTNRKEIIFTFAFQTVA